MIFGLSVQTLIFTFLLIILQMKCINHILTYSDMWLINNNYVLTNEIGVLRMHRVHTHGQWEGC